MTTPGVRSARRRAELSPLRRLARNVLVVGTVLAVVAAFGPVWVVRAGLLIAVAAAVVSCTVAWREVAEARRAHAAEMLAATRSHGATLSAERRHNASVVETLTARSRQARVEVEQHRSTIVELTGTITTLRAQLETSQGGHRQARHELRRREAELKARQSEVEALQQTVRDLQETVRSRESELAARSGTRSDAGAPSAVEALVVAGTGPAVNGSSENGGEVRTMPRRLRTEEPRDAADAAEDLWPDREPSVVDLVGPVLLPNYEGERRLA